MRWPLELWFGRAALLTRVSNSDASTPPLWPICYHCSAAGSLRAAEGREYVALNPKRADRHLGSFRVNLTTGKWADFATGDGGEHPVTLAAYLFDLSQAEAARRLAAMLGLPGHAHGKRT